MVSPSPVDETETYCKRCRHSEDYHGDAGCKVPTCACTGFIAFETEEEQEEEDLVNHPSHYGGDTQYEVIKVLEAWGIENPRLFNAIKYIARSHKKGAYLQDLQKAAWYLNREIQKATDEMDVQKGMM